MRDREGECVTACCLGAGARVAAPDEMNRAIAAQWRPRWWGERPFLDPREVYERGEGRFTRKRAG